MKRSQGNSMKESYDKDYFDLMERNYQDRIDGIRFQTIIEMVRKIKPKMILDAGCGSGVYLLHFTDFADKIYGIDFSEIACRMARQNTKQFNNITIKRMDLTKKLDFQDSSFDFILCSEVLEHIKDDKFTLSELKRILKPNGLILITGPNFTFLSVEYLRHKLFYKDPTHYHNYSIFEWSLLLSQFFKLIRIKTMTHYISILLFYLKLKKLSFIVDKIITKIPLLNKLGRDVNIILKK